jgi:hypothetical protein
MTGGEPVSHGHSSEDEAPDEASRSFRDLWAAAAVLAFCAVAFTVTLTFETVPDAIAQGMQPAGFPQLVIATMVGLALLVAWQTRAGVIGGAPPPVHRLVYWSSLVMIVSMPVMVWFDFFVALTIATYAMGYLWGERRLLALAIYSVLQSIVLFIVFATILRVRFPHGFIVDLVT